MSIASLFKAGLTHLRRVFGAYKRFGIDKIISLDDILTIPKRPTRGSLRNLAKVENQIRAIGERAVRERKMLDELERKTGSRDPNLFLQNLEYTLEQAVHANKQGAEDAMRSSFKLLWDMVDRSIKEVGSLRTAMKLIDYAADLEQALTRLVQAIYDEEFQNKRYLFGKDEWRKSTAGAAAYKAEIKRLSSALGIPYSNDLLEAMGGNLIY